jgi:hypothetical protein
MKRQIRPFQFLERPLSNHFPLLQQKDHVAIHYAANANPMDRLPFFIEHGISSCADKFLSW